MLSAQYKKINLIYLLVLCTVEEGKSFISTVSHDIGVNILFRESSLLLILFRESNLLLNNDRQHGKSDIELPPCIAEFLTFTLFHYFLFISTGQNHLLYTRDTNPLLCVIQLSRMTKQRKLDLLLQEVCISKRSKILYIIVLDFTVSG